MADFLHLNPLQKVVHRDGDCHHCVKCGFKAAKREDLKSHMESVQGDGNKHHCAMCGFKAVQREDLKSHVENVHRSGD